MTDNNEVTPADQLADGEGYLEDNKIYKLLQAKFADVIVGAQIYLGELTVEIKPESLLGVMQYLFEAPELDFKYLADISGVDWPDRAPRFDMVYHLLSIRLNHRLRIKCGVAEDVLEIASLVPIWGTANWQERENYDMFGIKFTNHPDMRRIYMPEDWDGYPLRKDYPLKGYE